MKPLFITLLIFASALLLYGNYSAPTVWQVLAALLECGCGTLKG